MNDKEFMDLMGELEQYLAREKVFIKNPARIQEFNHAREIAQQLFRYEKITVQDDPLQMGALILRIEGFGLVIRGQREIALFCELISKASNVEIYSNIGDEQVNIAILFNDALIRVPQEK